MDIINNKEEKFTFAGIALSGTGTIESAVAVINRDSKVLMLDKLFSMNDVKYFLDNFPGKQNSVIAVSVPYNETMLSHKWKYNSRTYDLVNFDKKMMNRDGWTNRFSTRGSEYFKELAAEGLDIFRYYTDDLRSFFVPQGAFKERTPIDCKALQDVFRLKYGMRELPVNMLPVAQLEAIAGALFAKEQVTGELGLDCKILGEFENLPVIGFELFQ